MIETLAVPPGAYEEYILEDAFNVRTYGLSASKRSEELIEQRTDEEQSMVALHAF